MALPILAGMALNSLYSLVDAFWLGKMRVGAREALAAVGPTAALTFIVVAFGMGFGSGGTALVAQHTGAKRPRQADQAAGQTLLLLTLVTTVMAALMFIFAPQMLSLLQTPAEVKPQALAFLRILLIGMPFIAFNIGYGSALRALGDTLTMVMVGVCTNLLNFGLSPLLIFGWGPVPAMGIRGAATVGAFAEVLTAVSCVVLLRRGRSGLRLTWADFRPNKQIIRQIFRIGLPAGVSMSSNSLGFLVLQGMINSLGTTVMGAYTIGSRITEIFGIPASALAMSTAPVVGQALGAGKPEVARRAVRTSVTLFAFGMLAPYVLIMAEGHIVARAFIRDARVIAEAGRFFLIVPASNYFFNVLMVLMSAFYGSGHTRPIMVISLLRQWVLRVPMALLLGFVAGWGSFGIYFGLAGANVIAAVLAWRVFSMGEWERGVVPSRTETPDAAPAAPETTRT
jgi:putative MATE family efflux protein